MKHPVIASIELSTLEDDLRKILSYVEQSKTDDNIARSVDANTLKIYQDMHDRLTKVIGLIDISIERVKNGDL